MLLGFVFIVMGITLYQERKTEQALEALLDLSSPRERLAKVPLERGVLEGEELAQFVREAKGEGLEQATRDMT